MDTTFLTIAEAVEKTGRSPSTIRRVIKSIADHDTHADRAAIEPTPKQVATFKKKGENFTWKIREDVLIAHSKTAPVKEKKIVTEAAPDIMSIIQKELDLKNQQIEKQWEVIHALNDRLREGNILMGSLQKRLSLPQAESPAENVVEATSMTASAPSSTKPAKRKIFGWIRR